MRKLFPLFGLAAVLTLATAMPAAGQSKTKDRATPVHRATPQHWNPQKPSMTPSQAALHNRHVRRSQPAYRIHARTPRFYNSGGSVHSVRTRRIVRPNVSPRRLHRVSPRFYNPGANAPRTQSLRPIKPRYYKENW